VARFGLVNSSELAEAFRAYLSSRGLAQEALSAHGAVDAVVDFYLAERIDDVELADDGDGLLFQWGTYDFGQGPTFTFDLTRQTISTAAEDDDDVWQLRLSLHFAPTAETAALGSGDRWCWTPEDVPEFRQFIGSEASTQFASTHRPLRVELEHFCAG
jgi:hypothetical protein